MSLQSNAISHWLGASLESALTFQCDMMLHRRELSKTEHVADLEPWWCHHKEMVTELLALCAGNPPFIGGFPAQRASITKLISLWLAWTNCWTHSWVAFDLRCSYDITIMTKQRVLMHRHQGWNVRHGLCHIYMIYIYIWVVYSFCLFCCLFIIVTWWYIWCIVWQVASKRKYRHVW